MHRRKLAAALLCGALLLTACTPTADGASEPEVEAPSDPTTSDRNKKPEESEAAIPEEPVVLMERQYSSALLGPYGDDFSRQGVSVTGSDLVLDAQNHRVSFLLRLEGRQGAALALPVEGTYVEDTYGDDFSAATWGGLCYLDGETLALYTGESIRFLSVDTLEELRPAITLPGYGDCWVLGFCVAGDGYAAAVGGPDRGEIVFLDAAGEIERSVAVHPENYFRISEKDYYTGQERYAPGFALETYPAMTMLQLDATDWELVLLEQDWHSSWATSDGVGHLDRFEMVNPENGATIRASEDFYHTEGERRYTFLHYSGSDSDDPRGYMAMIYDDNGERAAAVAFPGPPSYDSYHEQAQWTISGDRVELVTSPAGMHAVVDFAQGTGTVEYRFTPDQLTEDPLAVSPDGRYRLHAVNLSGAGDGYWGQMVLADSRTGSIELVCNLPVRYGGDEASTNFADNTHFTTADGGALRVYTVDDPLNGQPVQLSLPGDPGGVLYCNAIYDIQNDRYLLAYLDGVGIDRGGWHDYDGAVYHVAVFDGGLELVQDVAVPGLEITHSLYAMPCPGMVWDGESLELGGVRVEL